MRRNYVSILKLQRCNRWSLGTDKYVYHTLYWACDYLSVLWLKLIHISKRGQMCLIGTRISATIKLTHDENLQCYCMGTIKMLASCRLPVFNDSLTFNFMWTLYILLCDIYNQIISFDNSFHDLFNLVNTLWWFNSYFMHRGCTTSCHSRGCI